MNKFKSIVNKKVGPVPFSVIILLALIIIIGLVAFGFATKDDVKPNGKTISANQLVADPSGHRNSSIEFVGKVFVAEGTKGEQAIQLWSQPEQSEGNIAIYNYTQSEYSEGDFLKVKGTVFKPTEGENAFGTNLTVPVVIADSIEEVNADEAIAPAIKTLDINQTKSVGKLEVKLTKIEYAKKETRLYLEFDNEASFDYSFYSFDSKLILGRESIKEKTPYDRGDITDNSTITAGTVQKVKLYYGNIPESSPFTFTVKVVDQ